MTINYDGQLVYDGLDSVVTFPEIVAATAAATNLGREQIRIHAAPDDATRTANATVDDRE